MGHLSNLYCYPKHPNDRIEGTRFGQNLYDNTANLRKADFLPLSVAVRKTSYCFAQRGDTDNKSKAKTQLTLLKNSDIYALLPLDEQNRIDDDLKQLER